MRIFRPGFESRLGRFLVPSETLMILIWQGDVRAVAELQNQLKHDPLPSLLSSNIAVRTRTEIEFMGASETLMKRVWNSTLVRRILSKQQKDGSWRYPGKRPGPEEEYEYLETFRNLGWLVEKYSMTKEEAAVKEASEFLFSRQTDEGDIRGIYGNQYSPNYSAAVMELLIKAGYQDDERVEKGFQWLLSMRQEDGGWAIPLRTGGGKFYKATPAHLVQPDRSKPFSHLVTGMVLRAFAAHPRWRSSSEARRAGNLLLSRFFSRDKYSDRGDPSYWIKFRYPFWFTDLLSSLDSLSRMGFSPDQSMIEKGLKWFAGRQREDGTWRLYYLAGGDKDIDQWVAFAICRTFKRFHDLRA